MFSGMEGIGSTFSSIVSEASKSTISFFFLFFCDVASIDFISLVIALTSSTPSHLMID